MIKILNGNSVGQLDKLHCEVSGQHSLDLMEQAADSFVTWFLEHFSDRKHKIAIFCGAGNNGGDGFAIGRLLREKGFEVHIIKCFSPDSKLSEDAQTNLDRLPLEVDSYFFNSNLEKLEVDVILDAFLGVGLTGDLRENAKGVIGFMNQCDGVKIAVDIPSGLPSDGLASEHAFKADFTISFAFPKLSLLLPDNAQFSGDLVVQDIGILPELYDKFDSDFYFLTAKDIPQFHRKFHRFSHKGDFGKVLLIGGSPGKMGALHLSAKSALRTGAGLVSCHLDESERLILQSSLPEAMCLWGDLPNLGLFDAIGIGPGWGVEPRKKILEELLRQVSRALVLDADAITILAENKKLLDLLPENSILTPHPGEFDRLLGKSKNHLERLEKAKEFSEKRKVVMVLKGANTVVSLPDGRQIFNSTGSKFMATGGSGDVLTGMITAFLGMGYQPEHAALCGVFHHGLAGEIAGSKTRRSTIASDLIAHISETYIQLGID
ncbi:NAD(P)H-hydrate dehydratase [Algoriphagus hitonicola]|uniref:Bifunctional NAD(P)H-hydrate repair enzyme n=1 Tax=Algoriphagus hitonicola TaxID=435880 RepID=A0A1I2V9L9_9BACT|nr:NAD(P)H-hydrate dehydratase [Algoriphagus hitonicola]SFG84877.1 NAD(P)H-hydrate epimerase [Algoriphagus hitonicola]